ncbi:hypothetical protein CPB83DRAFT_678042 [Crepidotus variabilis]|uniref:Uncharacterized protein n=1 Tax=Crepidotus variabilis TaxID=179855 RepID=A0A9P6ENW8_9AGAR|nr:hypothetical protein CPB83DRAFT_678042 [Crepidotus variabilis]
MSAPPSPRIGHATQHSVSQRTRDRPAALHLPEEGRKAVSDGEVRYERAVQVKNAEEDQLHQQPQHQPFDLNVSAVDDSAMENEPERTVSRSTSATSTLDPYYFGIQSESDEPVPPLPTAQTYLSPTPEYQQPMNEPTTPARNPAMIDRRGLVGVGELTTPRWTRPEKHYEEFDLSILDAEAEGYDVVSETYDPPEDPPDSPWTIEAVDGELSEKEELSAMHSPSRPLRSKPSIADESGGEEILYPRNYPSSKQDQFSSSDDTPKVPRTNDNALTSPPSAFSHSSRTARKRTSDEFVLDQAGSLVPKSASSPSLSKDKLIEDKATAARKHRSLNVSSSSNRDSKGKERRRESSLTLSSNIKSPASVRSPDRHVRQVSGGSASSSHDTPHSRRVPTTDFSHLPPSPSSNSIQHFLRNAGTSSGQPSTPLHRPSKDSLHAHTSPNVAHSLLRGTQEGWSSLDDEATAEALRKLDGLTGKGARARASVSSFGRPGSSSRPVTPASKTGSQWEGLSASESGKSKRGSKDNASIKDKADLTRSGTSTVHPDAIDLAEGSAIATSSDDQLVHVSIQEKTPKKSTGVRLSFTPKRGSTSSTTYTGTPSSRDSASMSATTSVTSVSVTSGRHSSNKARRNSAGSDISSVHSSDAAFKDRVASIAHNGDITDEADVPPVPPLPKDLSSYRSPPGTSSGLTFPTIPNEEKSKTDGLTTSHSISLDVNPYTSPIVSPRASSSGRRESVHYSSASGNESLPIVKTPSKKWSFSSALNLKIGTPSNKQSSSSFPLSPRSVTFGQQIRKSNSKDRGTPATSPNIIWSPNQEAMSSAQSLASLSSVGSIKSPIQPINSSKTPEKPHASSRPGTGSSISTNHTTSGLAAPQGPLSPSSSVKRSHSKRLTPSSIPFFSRRSSSQSMQLPPPHSGMLQSTSPTATYSGMLSTQTPRKKSSSPAHDINAVSTPGTTQKKSSMLSLGLPSLLKSSSRRSLHSDAKESDKEVQKPRKMRKTGAKAASRLS